MTGDHFLKTLYHHTFPADMRSVIPKGTSGTAHVDHFTVDEYGSEITRIQAIHHGDMQEFVPVGDYIRLIVGNDLMMSNTWMEEETNERAVHRATGHVMVGGLGLGMVTLAMLNKSEVKSVTVYENCQDVINLVAKHLRRHLKRRASCFKLISGGDIRTGFVPTHGTYDYIYLDIWPRMCTDDIADRNALARRWRKSVVRGGRVDTWGIDKLRRQRRKEQRIGPYGW